MLPTGVCAGPVSYLCRCLSCCVCLREARTSRKHSDTPVLNQAARSPRIILRRGPVTHGFSASAESSSPQGDGLRLVTRWLVEDNASADNECCGAEPRGNMMYNALHKLLKDAADSRERAKITRCGKRLGTAAGTLASGTPLPAGACAADGAVACSAPTSIQV